MLRDRWLHEEDTCVLIFPLENASAACLAYTWDGDLFKDSLPASSDDP